MSVARWVDAQGLGPREREVYARAVMSKSIEETALEMGVGKFTVITYR